MEDECGGSKEGGGNYRGVKGTKKGKEEREKNIEPKEVIFPALVGNACDSVSEGEESGGLARFVTVRGRVAFPKARPPL